MERGKFRIEHGEKILIIKFYVNTQIKRFNEIAYSQSFYFLTV